MGDPKRLLCPGGFHRVLLSLHNISVRQESWLNKPGPISKSGFPGGLGGKESACNEGDLSSILELGRSPGEGHGNPFQYSRLENSMDKGAWWAPVHGVTKSQTRLSD